MRRNLHFTFCAHFPDCARVCVQVTGWPVAQLWSWNWHVWKMGQTQGQLKAAPSVEPKKTLLILRRNGSEYWQKVILPLVKKSLHSMSVSLKATLWGGWGLVGVAHWLAGVASADRRSWWVQTLCSHYVKLTRCCCPPRPHVDNETNAITTPSIHEATKPVSLFENHRGAFQLLNTKRAKTMR